MTDSTNDKNIIRTPKTREWTATPNASANDSNLSFDARGLLWYLLSKPDDWVVIPADIEREGDIGRDKAAGLLKELRQNGYLVTEMLQDESGRFAGKVDRIYDRPVEGTVPPTKKPRRRTAIRKSRNTANHTSGNPHLLNNKGLNTDIDKEKDSAASGAGTDNPPPSKVKPIKFYDLIATIFDAYAGRNGDFEKMLRGTATKGKYKEYRLDPAMTEEELAAWYSWYASEKQGDLSMLQKLDKIQSSIVGWREAGRPVSTVVPEKLLALYEKHGYFAEEEEPAPAADETPMTEEERQEFLRRINDPATYGDRRPNF